MLLLQVQYHFKLPLLRPLLLFPFNIPDLRIDNVPTIFIQRTNYLVENTIN